MSAITIIGAGMMGSAMARPASDNGHRVRLIGSPLDHVIIDALKAVQVDTMTPIEALGKLHDLSREAKKL